MKIVDSLVSQLKKLPGVGEKTALRFAFYYMTNPDYARSIADELREVSEKVSLCSKCLNLSFEGEICEICLSQRENILCVVNSVSDIMTLERTGLYRGYYFVIHKLINPADGIFESDLQLEKIKNMITEKNINEIVLMLGFSPEAEITIEFVREYFQDIYIKLTRPARGIPIGAHLEFIDDLTLKMAFQERKEITGGY